MKQELIAELDELAARCWPAADEELHGGWTLRYAGGFTFRANSVRARVLDGDAEAAIDEAERAYRARGLRAVFHLSPVADPPDLDERLARRGYALEHASAVLACDIAEAMRRIGPPPHAVELGSRLDQPWLETFRQAERRWPSEQNVAAEHVLTTGADDRRFALASVEGAPAATGYARIADEWLYLSCIATVPALRRGGLGRAVSAALLGFGHAGGARSAFLEVDARNEAAIALYASLGFRPVYGYHYRVG